MAKLDFSKIPKFSSPEDIEIKNGLPTFDDMLTNDIARANKNRVQPLPITDLHEFPGHPFKVLDNEDMDTLVESIKNQGVLEPIKVRVVDNDNRKYQIISGHRRRRACEILGIEKIPALILDVDEDTAKIMMVDSNSQRSKILPSEKAFAYKMKMDAMKHQGERKTYGDKTTSCQVGTKSRSDETLAQISDDSARQIQRFIRLTELIPALLSLVDEERIKLNPAVELSYLSKNNQQSLLYYIGSYEATPSLSQAKKMKALEVEGKLSPEVIKEMLAEEKPNQKEKPIFKGTGIDKLIPDSWDNNRQRAFVAKAVSTFSKLPQTVTEQDIIDAYKFAELAKDCSDEEILEYAHTLKKGV